MFNTPTGLRVLARIAQICDPAPIGPHEANDAGKMAFHSGMRWVMCEINRCLAGRGARPTNRDEEV